MNIYLTSSLQYIKHALELVFSIRKFSKKHLNVFLMIDINDNDVDHYQDAINKINFLNTNVKILSAQLLYDKMDMFYMSKVGPFSRVTFGRLAIPYLTPRIDKLLCMDCDMLVKGFGLDELYDLDMSTKYCIACDDVAELYFDQKELALCNVSRYFNNGITILNLKQLNEDGISKVIADSFIEHDLFFEKSAQIDQSFVNFLFKENVIFADPKYNVQSNIFGYKQYDDFLRQFGYVNLQHLIDNAVVVHFNGRAKPWDEHNFINWQHYQLPFRAWQKPFYENNKNEMIRCHPEVQYFYENM